MQMQTELVVTTTEAAIAAQQAGASRIELCQQLSVGGITPSIGLVHTVCEHCEFPVHVLIRPRAGDFVYSSHEVGVMVHDIRAAVDVGVDCIVVGALTQNHTMDLEAMKRFADAADGTPITFHRAFDVAADPLQTLDDCIALGIQRILTSGQRPTAPEGADLIADLITRAGTQLTILPGSGINAGNVQRLIARTSTSEVHFSAMRTEMQAPTSISMGSGDAAEQQREVFDLEKATAVLNAIR